MAEENSLLTEDETTSRRMDPELRVIGTMLRLLGELEEEARSRVVDYLSRRYYSGRE